MSVYMDDGVVQVFHGDCVEVMRTLADNSVDAVVTDPPYGLEFMGKEWDKFKTGRGAAYSRGGSMSKTEFKNLGTLPQYVSRPAKRCGICGKQAWSGSPCKCPEPQWVMDNSPLHSFQDWFTVVATEALRVLKPGGHLLAFGGTRTWHRLAVAIEDAGFEVRDSIAWMYGSGFPKSLDVSKAIDKNNGEVGRKFKFTKWMCTTGLTAKIINEATQTEMGNHYLTHPTQPAIPTPELWQVIRPLCGDVPVWVDELVARIAADREVVGRGTSAIANKDERDRYTVGAGKAVEFDITAPATPAAQQWQGWGTALKPAFEPIVVARKPLIGTVAENVLTHGTGGLNIDGCRIGTTVETWPASRSFSPGISSGFTEGVQKGSTQSTGEAPAGRWPANVILDESQAAELDKQSGVTSSKASTGRNGADTGGATWNLERTDDDLRGHNDSGGASRFFYCAKAPKKERPNVDGIAHPTVKPLKLMEYLVRLVTPPGGTVLEPFAGSGATIEAAVSQGFQVIAIEQEWDYIQLIEARLSKPIQEAM